MPLSIRDFIMKMPNNKTKMLAGTKAKDKNIHFYAYIEKDNININCKKGGLYFTSSNFVLLSIKKQKELIYKLINTQSAGLLMNIDGQDVADEIINIANEHKFPILVSGDSDIYMKLLTGQLNIQRDSTIKRMENIKKELTKVVLMGGGIDLLAQAIYKILSTPVIIQNNKMETLIQIGEVNNNIFNKKNNINKSDILKEYMAVKKPLKYKINKEYINIIFPIIYAGKTYGFILIFENKESQLKKADYWAIEYAAVLIGLEILKKKHEKSMHKVLKTEVINNIFTGEYKSEKEVIEKAKALNWDLNKNYSVMIININNNFKLEDKLKQIMRTLKREVNWELNMLNIENILLYRDNKLIIFFHKNLRMDQNLKDFSLNLAKKIKENISIDVSISIGGNNTGLSGLKKGYRQALLALKLGDIICNNNVFHYNNLGVFKLLTKYEDDPDLLKYYHETLGPLLEAEDEDLLKTLKALLKHFGNKTRAAEELYIHRNSLSYRIEKIEELLDISLQENENWLNLFLAMKIHEIIKN